MTPEEKVDAVHTCVDMAGPKMIQHYLSKGKNAFKCQADVMEYVSAFREPVIGTKKICNQPDHCPQSDVFVDILTGKQNYTITWANRGSSKTYGAGLIIFTKSNLFKKMQTNILGASEQQSKLAYAAMDGFWDITGLRDKVLVKDPEVHRTQWKNGSQVNILTASMKAVRGPHPQSLHLDELDEMEDAIYQSALSQPQANYGIPASIHIWSTNHQAVGLMDAAIEMAKKNQLYKLYKYCIWECIASCVGVYECSTCPLSSICPGPQVKGADGYYQPADLSAKLLTLSFEVFQREWLCIKVGFGDTVYEDQYDPEKHILREYPVNYERPVYLSIDWGGDAPFSVGVWQNDPELDMWVRVDEVFKAKTSNTVIMEMARERRWWKLIKGVVADPARPDLFTDWGHAGIEMTRANNAYDEGLDAVKNALAPMKGPPKIGFSSRCQNVIREFSTYKSRDGKPLKKDDHCMDEVRYFTMWKVADNDGDDFFGTSNANVMPS